MLTLVQDKGVVMSTAVDQCLGIVVAYHGDIDRGRATAAIDHFTADASFEARGEQLQGREQILGFLADRERRTDRHTVHVVTNASSTQTDDGIAVSALVLLHVRGAQGYALERVLDTVHRFRPTEQGWKIAARTSAPLHRGA
jgi:ketosteroid isomerase-like protein